MYVDVVGMGGKIGSLGRVEILFWMVRGIVFIYRNNEDYGEG